MSIYLNEKNPEKHKPFDDASQDIVEYVRYLEVIAGKSPHTAFNYYCDLRNFSRFMKRRRALVPEDAEIKEIDPKGFKPGMRKQKVFYRPAAGQSARIL